MVFDVTSFMKANGKDGLVDSGNERGRIVVG